jgi:hypothetical protein
LHHGHPQVNGSIAMQMIRRRKGMRADGFLASAVAAAESGVEPQAPDAEDVTGTAALCVFFRNAAAPAPDAQAGPP